MTKSVLLFSGGMDSLIAFEYLNQPDTVYVDLGHRYASQEVRRAMKVLPETRYVKSRDFGSMFEKPDAEIPLRNLHLAMIAANLGYDQIWLSVQRNEMSVPDRTDQFFIDTSALLTTLSGRPIKVDTPFRDYDKVEMVAWYKHYGRNLTKLRETWACYRPTEEEHCGDCPACFRRFVAMKLNDIHEPWHWKVPLSHTADEYRKKVALGQYPEDRSAQILKALNSQSLRPPV